ncbi:MAG: class I SAM-dependent methyltransferase [bacterium]
MGIEPYPHDRQEIAGFFRKHASFGVCYLKVERSLEDFGQYLCEMVLESGPERLFLQGIQFAGKRFRYPPHLEGIPSSTRVSLEREILTHLLRSRVVESPLTDPKLTYTGERIVPATAPFHAYWMHARRYEFAARRVSGCGTVLDAGCGSGYGTRILSRAVSSCLGVDVAPAAVDLARSLFRRPGVEFAVGDVCRLDDLADGAFDAVVALEVLEHLERAAIPLFLATVRRVLRDRGGFIVSVANSGYSAKEVNPYHRSEMTFGAFRDLLAAEFPQSSAVYFGQDVWQGSYRLERECRIVPVQGPTDHHVFLAALETGGLGHTGSV